MTVSKKPEYTGTNYDDDVMTSIISNMDPVSVLMKPMVQQGSLGNDNIFGATVQCVRFYIYARR